MDGHDFHRRGRRMGEILSEVETYLQHNDWDGTNLAAFSNGTLDLNTNILRPGHDPKRPPDLRVPISAGPPQRSAHAGWGSSSKPSTPTPRKYFGRLIAWTIKPKKPDAPFPFEKAFDIEGPKGCGQGSDR